MSMTMTMSVYDYDYDYGYDHDYDYVNVYGDVYEYVSTYGDTYVYIFLVRNGVHMGWHASARVSIHAQATAQEQLETNLDEGVLSFKLQDVGDNCARKI